MGLFSSLSTILYFDTIFDFNDTMQDIDNCLGDYIIVVSAYKMMGVERLFRFSYFQVVS